MHFLFGWPRRSRQPGFCSTVTLGRVPFLAQPRPDAYRPAGTALRSFSPARHSHGGTEDQTAFWFAFNTTATKPIAHTGQGTASNVARHAQKANAATIATTVAITVPISNANGFDSRQEAVKHRQVL